MKKVKLSLLTGLLSVALVAVTAAGCAKTPAPTPATPTPPANPDVILATTTSTQDSGLLDVLLPLFKQKTGYNVKTIAVGTGAALQMGRDGTADVLLVHAPSSEQPLVDEGIGINYQLIMHNDFIIVGPPDDPAKVKSTSNIDDALKAIYNNKAIFVSRGDDSGTDKAEKALWKKINLKPEGANYQEAGSGMGATLKIASEKGGYTMTDRATYLANKANLNLEVVREGDASLLNVYHVMQVNPDKFPNANPKINAEGAKAFVEFLIDADTQKTIGEFGKDKYGEPLFTPDYGKTMADLGFK